MSLLVISQILGLFVNTFTVDHLYFPVILRIYSSQFKCIFLGYKFMFHFCAAFLKFPSNFKDFQKKIALMAHVFPSLETTKDVVG